MATALVIGLGNPALGDDGIGWRIVEEVAQQLRMVEGVTPAAVAQAAISDPQSVIEVDCVSLGGLRLMERMAGYDRVILVDAITTGHSPIGTVSCFPLAELPDPAAGHLSSAHDTTLTTALEVGRRAGILLPQEIIVVAIEIEPVYNFTEALSPPVAAAIPAAIQKVQEVLHKGGFVWSHLN